MKKLFACLAVTLLALAAASGQYDYYVFSLSWAPEFCAQPGAASSNPQECGPRKGFVVHGLWPEVNQGRSPEACQPARPVSKGLVNALMPYMPSAGLIQHEWATHGTCSGLTASDFFAALRKARDSVAIPAGLNPPSQELRFTPGQIESKFAAANPRYPGAAFRASCYRDAELQEVRVCLNKDLSPRACGASAGKCAVANVTMLPVR